MHPFWTHICFRLEIDLPCLDKDPVVCSTLSKLIPSYLEDQNIRIHGLLACKELPTRCLLQARCSAHLLSVTHKLTVLLHSGQLGTEGYKVEANLQVMCFLLGGLNEVVSDAAFPNLNLGGSELHCKAGSRSCLWMPHNL